jgi:hypothetical protein
MLEVKLVPDAPIAEDFGEDLEAQAIVVKATRA